MNKHVGWRKPHGITTQRRYNIALIKGYQLAKFIRVVMSHSGQAIDKKSCLPRTPDPAHRVYISFVNVHNSAKNDLHYRLLLLSSAGCIAISTGCAHNKFPFPCSNGYWNVALIVYSIGAFYFLAK
ncbi:hypothetical protein CQP30_12375 [Yersinia pestis]|uniref:Membrane protein n=3 Tax=Yersinia pestis TaxID=632 RepID=A0A384LM17_YERPE|nr:hypothetical protein BAY22_10855 [Yersinia pestis]EDM42143.1 putative membrane protein [Yersinia pestis CA88-4125]EEO76798.1 putative membrane protein [Yersinia pestis Nepal516]EEO80145.1 putative membrane protein [Yersinia pestis biovar Orientalis str. India 195]EEO84377.1 putative membrane protein [Yersinia pestis biovar Orientalis str. PEXU2]EEO89911.1 putative membrane protein [Yersinia pestis Pestoides A]KJG86680.1 membrane protein [Yersinia pestis subsp. microtus bv. Ulegeica]KKM496